MLVACSQEDPRGFSLQGRLYILVNIGMKMLREPDKPRVRRIFLLAVEPDGAVKETLMVQVPGVMASDDVKNTVPIVNEAEGTVGIVHSFVPFRYPSLLLRLPLHLYRSRPFVDVTPAFRCGFPAGSVSWK